LSFEIVNPEELGAPSGWNNGMLAPAGGRLLFVAGQVGSDQSGQVEPLGFVEQFSRALGNVVAVVRHAGGDPEDIGRLTIYVTNREEYLASRKPLGQKYRALMGNHYPAIALVEVAGLVEADAVVEIEATAVVPEKETT
jgi:enamine deaminase RidA (YjgF/YER057c/UK114 family)